MRWPESAVSVPRALFASAVLVLVVASGCARPLAPSPTAPEHWPVGRWQTASPESEGIDSGVLLELLAFAAREDPGIHSLLIVRRGRLVLDAAFYPYDGETPHDVASVTKSVTTTLLGAALHAGALDRLNRPIVELLGRDGASLDPAKREITLEHLASMRSGLACGLGPGERELIAMTRSSDWVGFTLDLPMSDPPGQRSAYCSPGMHLLSAAITELTGESEAEFAAHGLFAPLGIVPGDWPRDRAGLSHGWGDLRLRPRDMAKIGLLMLHDGVWNGRRLLPAGWVTKATQSRGPVGAGGDGYGLGWWVLSGEPAGAFEARGRGGQRILVWPALDLVIVTTGAGFEPGVLVPFLSRAIRSKTALPENEALSRQLEDALAAARAEPTAVRAALPELASRISGRTYEMEVNPLGFERIGFEFQSVGATFLLELSDAMGAGAAGRFTLKLGLDGRYRTTPAGPRGYAVAVRGAWRGPSGLDLDYVEPHGSNAFVIRAEFEAERIRLSVRDQTGLYGEHLIVGRLREK
jgi:CubicO group peptidase (beta-lactamase class C family)